MTNTRPILGLQCRCDAWVPFPWGLQEQLLNLVDAVDALDAAAAEAGTPCAIIDAAATRQVVAAAAAVRRAMAEAVPVNTAIVTAPDATAAGGQR